MYHKCFKIQQLGHAQILASEDDMKTRGIMGNKFSV
jgi:hypothetical protein